MRYFTNLLKRVFSLNAAMDIAVLEREFSVPTVRRSREGYSANHLSSLLKY